VEKEGDVPAFKDFKSADGDKADTPKVKPSAEKAKSPQVQQQISAPAPTIQPQPEQKAAPIQTSDRLKVTPYAKKLAAEQGISLDALSGSGPGGRIIASDISSPGAVKQEAAKTISGGAPGKLVSSHGQFEDIQLTNMRKTIARRLTESKSNIPHYYLTSEIIVDDLLK
jgi:pyruvate dehydrogenase E2 component (dihydrolipoamide acetyltransferase)